MIEPEGHRGPVALAVQRLLHLADPTTHLRHCSDPDLRLEVLVQVWAYGRDMVP